MYGFNRLKPFNNNDLNESRSEDFIHRLKCIQFHKHSTGFMLINSRLVYLAGIYHAAILLLSEQMHCVSQNEHVLVLNMYKLISEQL